ncbi:hypothetical protein TVAG_153600 [Trichomonas vaginalis G3]|uniref:Leucine Rich Repeat family protein n=1 Tax=Trichomonas vaginalis (strain ATCC PRA-98 / G3) TaxID=412133 RepID=A2EPR5_TRIV3|nr:hypothetical protein TVAGG3_0352790 [Trichomonas vaginalis G3]EAY05326.1 hypothetical protein TVAG_153600 [Trichomonas vaginalis G3]KAI5531411.1 hypothetical protein TVAGG3_0352790 [Trichomonas vaginalis G3]|eukprot:XP_001317549.1 hypothetical protein [Trichomonas vaginalis G3]
MRKRENRRQTFIRDVEEPIRKFTIGVHQRPIPEQKTVKKENNNDSPSVSKTFNLSLGVYISNMNNKKVNKDAISNVFYLDFTNTQNLESAFLKPLNNFANLQIISLSNTGLK